MVDGPVPSLMTTCTAQAEKIHLFLELEGQPTRTELYQPGYRQNTEALDIHVKK